MRGARASMPNGHQAGTLSAWLMSIDQVRTSPWAGFGTHPQLPNRRLKPPLIRVKVGTVSCWAGSYRTSRSLS